MIVKETSTSREPCKLPGSVCRNTCMVLLGSWDFMSIKLSVKFIFILGKAGAVNSLFRAKTVKF